MRAVFHHGPGRAKTPRVEYGVRSMHGIQSGHLGAHLFHPTRLLLQFDLFVKPSGKINKVVLRLFALYHRILVSNLSQQPNTLFCSDGGDGQSWAQ